MTSFFVNFISSLVAGGLVIIAIIIAIIIMNIIDIYHTFHLLKSIL